MARFTTAGGGGEGTPGATGPAGADGDSAYDIAVANGFVGTEQDWLDSLASLGLDISSVTGDILPSLDNTYVLGNSSYRWKSISVGDGTIYITDAVTGNEAALTIEDGIFFIDGIAQAQLPSLAVTNLTFADNSVQTTAYTGGSSADIADFVFDFVDNENTDESRITITNHDMVIRTTRDGEQDSDIEIVSADDARVTAEDIVALRAGSHVAIRTGWDSNTEDSDHRWEFSTEGQFLLPGNGYIENQGNSSGDGNNYSTIKIVPDANLETDQYLIIDPTVPNHIHIRAGGEQDSSNADLFIGAENTHVMVSDNNGTVSISSSSSGELLILNEATEPSLGVVTYNLGTLPSIGDTVNVEGAEYTVTEIDYTTEVEGQQIIYCDDLVFAPQTSYLFVGQSSSSTWNFNSSGIFSGPVEGLVKTYGLYGTNDGPLALIGPQGVVLDGDNGEFLNDASDPNNQIATLGDIQSSSSLGDFVFTAGTVTVNNDEILNIQANNTTQLKSQLVLNPTLGSAKLQAFGTADTTTFLASSPDWDSATWAQDSSTMSTVSFVNAPNIINFFATTPNNINAMSIVINDTVVGTYSGAAYGATDVLIYVENALPTEDPTVNSFSFVFTPTSYINIDQDDALLNIQASENMDVRIYGGDDVLITAGGDDITLEASDDIRFVSNTGGDGDEQPWRMNSEGSFTLPGDGFISNPFDSGTLTIDGGGNGEFLNDATIPGNQIATISDIANEIPVEIDFTVSGGTLGTQPTFNGAPLFSGTYVKTGPLVHFQIQVDMDNITNFGTGQYYVDLPFPAKYGYQVRQGCLHDISADRQYAIGGHVFAGESTLKLFFTDSNGQDQEFDHNSPINLNAADNFHVSGTYISQ